MKKSFWLLGGLALGLAAGLVSGCTGGGDTGGGGGPARPTRTPAEVATVTPAETPSDVATPAETGTPAPGTTPAAGGDSLEEAAAAEMPGVTEVQAIGKNPMADSPDAMTKGKELFVTNCAPCHGDAGKGGGPAAAALDPQPRDLTTLSEYKYGTGDLAIFRSAKYGVPDTGMAPWEGRLSDDELWQITTFVKSLQG
ncbi:MAG: c-type cytochrome [Armatimonadetes bacterium]|nr:c-type cytochrome [Armatimonadota bacterium]